MNLVFLRIEFKCKLIHGWQITNFFSSRLNNYALNSILIICFNPHQPFDTSTSLSAGLAQGDSTIELQYCILNFKPLL